MLLVLIAPTLTAQYVERIEVSVANIDVVVTDDRGNVVRGLTKDDFEVFEEGKRQAITNFYAYDAIVSSPQEVARPGELKVSSVVLPPPQRLVVIYIDLVSVPRYSRKVFFDGLSRFLDSILREGDLLAVLGWTHRVRTIMSPTSDRKQVDAVLASFSRGERSPDAIAQEIAETAVALHAGAMAGGLVPLTSLAEELAFQEFFVSEERCSKQRRKLQSMRNIVASLGRAELQKVLILASDYEPLQPSPTCNLWGFADEFATTANQYGVTVHGFHPAGERNASGVASAGVYYWPGTRDQPYGSGEALRSLDESAGLLRLAYLTGGVVGRGANASVAVMGKLREQFETYYSLGYRLSEGREDRPRDVRVKVKGRGYNVRTRKSVMRPSEASRLRDEVVTNLYLPPSAGGSPAFDASVIGVRREGRFRVVKIGIDVADSELLFPTGSAASFSILLAAGREVGDASDIAELRYQAAPLSEPGNRRHYEFETRVRPDTRRLSLALRDDVSGSVGTRVLDLPAMK